MFILGLDIGGANIKGATATGTAFSIPFPIWKQPDDLRATLQRAIARWEVDSSKSVLATSITAELADCFATKAEGVRHVVQAVAQMGSAFFWTTEGRWFNTEQALQNPHPVAAANWHVLATYLIDAGWISNGLLIDIGSTTTDLIPVHNNTIIARGRTDQDRMMFGELVYSGVTRTPLCALAQAVPCQQTANLRPLAAEYFATTRDLYLLSNELPEDPSSTDTANGKPATIAAAYDRLARQFCCDRDDLSFEEALDLADRLRARQSQQILLAIRSQLARLKQVHVASQRANPFCEQIIISGSGAFLAASILQQIPECRSIPILSLTERLGPDVSTAACAYACAKTAETRL